MNFEETIADKLYQRYGINYMNYKTDKYETDKIRFILNAFPQEIIQSKDIIETIATLIQFIEDNQ